MAGASDLTPERAWGYNQHLNSWHQPAFSLFNGVNLFSLPERLR